MTDTEGTSRPPDSGLPGGLPALSFESAEVWERWLAEHYDSMPGVWLRLATKGTGVLSVTMPEAVEGALCHGWVDSTGRRSEEEGYFLVRFTPRRARSKWSQRNRAKAEALIAEGRMGPGGLREVERAKADGEMLYP